MISRIMLHKNTLLCAGLSAAFLFAHAPVANAAVVASMKPLGFIASAIADGVTETQVLLPDGASEHDYSLRPSDVKRLQNADLVVWIGPEMEAFMDKSTQSIAEQKKVTIAQLDGVKPLLIKGRMMTMTNMVTNMLMAKKVTAITITAFTICICGSPQR
ncbi:Zinc ABC transporter, periplasmic-binding protein ZnuA [Klebsiella aerogenes]|nr:Zinc ABC transporter, periplasmic-binding protein ZnuA [Klebsiella aerogenes]